MKKMVLVFVFAILLSSLAGCVSSAPESTASESTAEEDIEIMIYLVRHGKTWFNTIDLVQGFSDSPLTQVGIDQANIVGRNMSDIKFTTAYSSSLGRQRDTLKLILDANKSEIPAMAEHDGLKEWNYGGYEGRTNGELWAPVYEEHGLTWDERWVLGDRGVADAFAANDPEQMAETYDEIITRAQAAMDQIVKDTTEAGGGNVLVVSSGGQIPTILETVAPGQYQGEYIGNCTVTILKYKNGTYTLVVAGDESYVAE